ncbi:hypothetical protein J8L98_13420 [Pseudoalteromonas sp. MMG013]|uniref:Uncharacterized protein n=1 Tax=Pseudoalteromonas aurantia 208 TaxID=1314867 RepID=A0ABR9E9L6_9GAMM|nr:MULTISPECIES: hypothetical protein [Pseudoalteromonas]MBE0366468.1 hypothetical protein [Pseudoalteromonas aurantia 208]MBQ4846584.1 hypothetical protein [Pseudoalteromonas sp. MMG005]MBQ4850713.1 hypothetical protein [Pseudoalteromonas sp. MMG012]MBQ4862690.1 hypothetical protein [Pseudoalteromonas sp. MMG013]
MKIKLNKKSLKQLDNSQHTLAKELTPQAAGGQYASSPYNAGCMSYQGLTCPTSPYDPGC